jgi:hypothetical protein
MAQNIILKRSSLPGKVPDTSSLNVGEVAINTYDGKLFIKRSGNTDSIQSILTTDSVTTGSITLTQTASVAELVVTQDANIQRDLFVTNDIIGAGDIDITGDITGSSALLSGSLIVSGSTTITDNLTVLGEVNARQFNINVISSSVIYQSGSTKFGDTIDDTHEFTGSIDVSGSIILNGIELGGSANSGSFTGSFTGSFIGDGSGLRGVVSDDLPVDGWDYQSNSSASISEFNTESRKYIIDFQWEEEVGTPIGFKTFISNVTGSSQIVPTEEGIKFIVGNQEVALVGPNGIQSVPPLGTVSGSSQLTSSYDTRYVLSGSITQTTWDNIASKPGGIVSGSSQVIGILDSLNTFSASQYISNSYFATTGSNTFNGNINITGSLTASGLIYPTTDGTEFSYLQTDGAGNLSFADVATTYDTIHNGEGSSLLAGTPLYVSGSNGANPIVYRADASNPLKMPVTYIAAEEIITNGRGILLGEIEGVNTTGYSAGTTIYVAEGGGWSSTRPSGSSSIVQVLGIVTKEGSGGKGLVLNPGPATLPNLQTGNIWVGNSTNQPVSFSTASLATTGSNTFRGTQTLSGSIIPAIDNTYDLGSPTYQWKDIYVSSGSLYIDGTKVLGSTGNELQITTDVGQSIKILEAGSDSIILQSADGDIQLKTSGGGNLLFDPTTGLIDIRGTLQIQDGYKVTSSGGNAIQFGNDLGITGSINTTGNVNGINLTTFSSSVVTQISTIQTKTGSLATTGSNTFFGTQTFSGSVYIANDLVVQGSSSIQYISASSVSIGTNIVELNTANPSVRYAGLSITDSGSVGGSGSFLYDSVQDEFIFVHRGNGVNVTSSHFVLGPETYDDLGNETYLTNNRLSKGTGKEHLNDSNITDTGTLITLGSNTVVNGTFYATNTTLVSGSAQVVGILSSLNTYTSSQDTKNSTIATYTASLDTKFTTLQSLTASNQSAITQINAVTASLNAATSSYETKGRGIVSGSSQVDVMSTTNIARLATTGSNIFAGNQTITGSLSTSDNITAGYNAAHKIVNSSNGQVGGFSRRGLWEGNSNNDPAIWAEGGSGFYIYTNGSATPKVIVETGGTMRPGANGTQDLGSSSYRWGTIYTSDLSLNNGIGDWTIVEGEDDLFLYNNKKGKVYKFALTEVDPNLATPKKS